jgi:glycosyltransferase involved in cell wall biosynthesis
VVNSQTIDIVYERQWRPLPYPVFVLQQLGRMGIFYGGLPKSCYIKAGIRPEIIRTFPLPSLWNLAIGKARLPRSLYLEEPKWVGKWVAMHPDLAPTVISNGTAHRFLFPRIRDTGRTLILERGSTHPVDAFERPRIARREAGFPVVGEFPAHMRDEIEQTKLADSILAASQYVRQSYVDQGMSPDKIHDCSFGIDTEAFPFMQREPARNRPIKVAVVGVIGFRKGLFRLLKMGDWARRKGVKLEIHFAGPVQDPEAYEMFEKSRAVCIRHGTIKGDRLKALLAECDLYALPSYEEGLPFSVLEAMSTGMAAIVSNDTGAREPVQHRASGLVLHRFDDDEFDAELEPVLRDPERILAMGRAARERIEENYTVEHYCQRIAAALAAIDGQKSEGREQKASK